MARAHSHHTHPAVHLNNPTFFVWAALVITTLATIAVVALIYATNVVREAYAYPSQAESDGWVTDGDVYSVTTGGGKTYVGGDFSYVSSYTGSTAAVDADTGAVIANAQFNPRISTGAADIDSVEPDGNGGWYVGGNFRSPGGAHVNGVGVNRIFHVDASGTYDPVFTTFGASSNVAHTISDMELDAATNTLYLVGSFSVINGVTRNSAAAVDATDGSLKSWAPVVSSAVEQVEVVNDRVYIVGGFTSVNATPRNRIAAIGKVGENDPTLTEGALDSWNPSICNGGVNGLEVKSDNSAVYVGGTFTTIASSSATCSSGQTTVSRLAAFNGANNNTGTIFTSWAPTTNNSVHTIQLSVDENTLYVGGDFSTLNSVAHSRLGAITSDPTVAAVVSATWVGSAAARVNELAVDGTHLFAVGQFVSASGSTRYRIAKFDGDPAGTGALDATFDPKANGTVTAIAIDITDNDVFIGGSSDVSGIGGVFRNRLAAFDSTTLDVDPTFVSNYAITAGEITQMILDGSNLYISGTYQTADADERGIGRVNATTGVRDTTWNPGPSSSVNGMVLDGTNLYVTGIFTDFDPDGTGGVATVSVDQIARLSTTANTTSANAADATFNPGITGGTSTADDIVQDATHIYVSGNFGTVGNEDIKKVSKATGTADAGFICSTNADTTGNITSLAIVDTQLYFTKTNDIARFSTVDCTLDTTWFNGTANSIGLISEVYIDTAANPDLAYYGGDFTQIGQQGSLVARERIAEIDISNSTISSWNPGFPGGAGRVEQVLRDGNALHVVGQFSQVGGIVGTTSLRYGYALFTTNTIGFTLAISSGSEATTPANLEISLGAIDGADTTVQYTVTGGTASGGGVDYTLANGTATVIAGTLTTNIPITIVNDAFNEPDQTIEVTLSSPSSNAVLGTNTVHTYTILDDDVPGISVVESGGTTAVTEGGPTDSYTVVLTSQPTADVTITLGSSGQASAAPSPLTFNSSNWNTPQTVTVTAANDDFAEGPHADAITHTVVSADGDYNGFSVPNVNVAITDNDVASVQITESGGSTQVIEGGAGDSYDVVLTSEPTNTVTVTLTVDPQLSAGPSPLTFTTGNWDTPQTVTVNADDDAVSEGLHVASITHAASSSDADYNGIAIDQVDVTITDNDSPAVNITESGGGTTVTEGGATDSYDVVLNTQPSDTVTITLTPDSQVTVAPNPLSFNTGNWDTPQTITVTALNDDIAEGTHIGEITHAATSSDSNYNGIAIVDVTASITDNDTAGLSVVQSGGTTQAAEGGAGDSYTIALTSEPTSNVTVTLAPNSQVTATPSPLTFTSGDWDTPQTVTVGAVNDDIAEGNHVGSVGHTVASADSFYNGLVTSPVSVSITDNDNASVVVNESGGNTTVTEGGATDNYTVVLTSEPTTDTQIVLSPSGQVSVMPSALLFNSGDWDVPQTVIVTAIDDSSVEGTHVAVIVQNATSSDPTYNGIAVDDVSVTINDDDVSPQTPTTPQPPPPSEPEEEAVNQIGGATARAQSIAVSQTRFADGEANGAVIATERTAVDAYTSEPLVSQNNYVLMLSDGTNVSADTLLEMKRVLGNPGKPVYLIGGIAALSENVEEDIRAAGFTNTLRLSGKDRRRTAELVADAIAQHNPQGRADTIFLGEDSELIDGLSSGSAAGTLVNGYATPILITRRGSTQLDPTVANFVKNHAVRKVQIIGGPTAVPFEIDGQLRKIAPDIELIRFAGANRYETNLQIVEAFFPSPRVAVAARGDRPSIPGVGATSATQANTLVTALLANTLGGQFAAPVVLVNAASVPDPTIEYLQKHANTIEKLYVVADFSALSQTVIDTLVSLI
jgi:putative cell wall-binding protein